MAPSDTWSADVRSSLTAQFLMAGAMQARAAAEIESRHQDAVTEDDKVAHRGFVVGAIMQSTAALECEIWEVMIYGPGHHLGSNGIDLAARDFLAPAAEVIDGESVLERYGLVLHLLKKKGLDRGAPPWQDAALVVRLRNELVHYKSRWGKELERSKLHGDGGSDLVSCYMLAVELLALNHGSSSQSRVSRRLIPYDLAP